MSTASLRSAQFACLNILHVAADLGDGLTAVGPDLTGHDVSCEEFPRRSLDREEESMGSCHVVRDGSHPDSGCFVSAYLNAMR